VQNAFRRLLFHYWYFRQPPWDTGISPPELLEFIEQHKPGRAIDIGCGTGTNVITLARHGWRVTGVDFAPRAITLAKRKIRNAGVQAELSVNDATKLDGISGPFDLVFDLGCFHGISQPGRAKYLGQLERILAPGGSWLMYGFVQPAAHPSQPGLAEAEISSISSRFTPVSRRDGNDSTRGRSSAWFLFQNKQKYET
jgi:cyclopropane fatty-acyl-phospholipid synthase-like methyltransferase